MPLTRALAFAAACALTGCTGDVAVPEFPVPPPSATAPAPSGALDALAALPVKGRAPKTDYSRAQFGPGWTDPDGDGCDTRDAVLARDATTLTVDADGCPADVTITDPYTGEPVTGRAAIDVDHVVALSDAWQKGAQQLTPDQRQAFALDPANLLAVAARTNRSKGDADAATWLPPDRCYRCAYVARIVAVKAAHGLWVTAAERDAIARVLDSCPGEPLP